MFGSLKRLFGGEEKEEKIIAVPVSGTAILMGQVSNPTFSQEIPGKGAAVMPLDGRVVAPADRLVTIVLDTKYTISVQTDNGAELVTHIGLDAVQLKGQYLRVHVTARDKIKQGDLLLDFEIDKTREAGYDVTTPVIICNAPQLPRMGCRNEMGVKAGETAVTKL